MGSIGPVHFGSPIRKFKYLESSAIFKLSIFAWIVTGLINVFRFGCGSLFAGEIISFFSSVSSSNFLFCKYMGTRLKTASVFSGRCSSDWNFPASSFVVAYINGNFNNKLAYCSNSSWLI